MKKYLKILSAVLAVIIAFQCPLMALAGSSKSKYTGKTYTHHEQFDDAVILNGIDVSEHNGTVNFNKVKADGIDFVFVRVGYTGYTKSRFSLNYDKNYKDNIKNAIDAGLAVGVYWYSQALTTDEAVSEAQKMLSVIGDYNITMPVVMDYEFASVSTGRLDSANLSKTEMTDNALAFLDTVNSAGYEGCLYASKNFLENHMYANQIDSLYKIWLAHYTTKTDYSDVFDYWQYTANGKVNGISGYVDINFWYQHEEITVLNDMYYTGKAITPTPAVTYDDAILIADEDYTLSYANNKEVGTAVITAAGINDYEGMVWKYKFRIIPERVKNVKLAQKRTTDTINIKWDSVPGATSYYVYIDNKTKGTYFTKTVKTNSAEINGLTPGNKYSIKVRAVRKMNNGAYSATLTAHTVPAKVTGLKTVSRDTGSVTISWDKQAGVTGYYVYRYTASSGELKEIAKLAGSGKTSYKIKGLNAGNTYSYKVSAYVEDKAVSPRKGAKSAVLKTAPKPKTPTAKKVSTPSTKKLKLTWNKAAGSGYQVQWSTTSNFSSNIKSVYVSSSNTLSKTVKTYQSKRKYYIRVRAYKTVNSEKIYSAWSSAKSIKVK